MIKPNTDGYYTPDCGEVPKGEKVCCGVCNDKMKVKRNCYGPRGFASAMAGSKHHYDSFTCPNYKEKWHEQVVKLRREARSTSSAKLAQMFLEEVDDILKNRKPTK